MHAPTHGRTDARMDGQTENIYSIFRDKLLLLGEHIYDMGKIERFRLEKQLLFYTEKLASILPNVTRVILPSW